MVEQSPPRSHTNSVHKREQSDRVCETEWKRLGNLIQSTLLFWGGRALPQSSFLCLLFRLPSYFYFFFFRGQNLKFKRKKKIRRRRRKKQTPDRQPGEREVGRGKERRGGERRDRRWRGAWMPVCSERLGLGEGAGGGRAKPLRRPALPQPAAGTPLPGQRGSAWSSAPCPSFSVSCLLGAGEKGRGSGFSETVAVAFQKNPVNCVSCYFRINSFFAALKRAPAPLRGNPPEVAPASTGQG